MQDEFFANTPRLYRLVICIALLSFLVRLLMGSNIGNSALLYVGIPILASLLLLLIKVRPRKSSNWKRDYVIRVIDAYIIMLGASVVLYEGFVCVIMFTPIYLFVILIMFLFDVYRRRALERNKSNLGVQILPLLIVLSSFEGVVPELSYDRHETVTSTRIVDRSISDIKENLLLPIELEKARPWFLAIFPMPTNIVAETLSPGDVHEIYFKYYRWFFTNLHTGRMLLEISEVEEDRIRTTFLEDTSYFAKYLSLKGTEINLEKIDDEHTRVSLTIDFERNLDPYWYFSPIERYGVSKTADFLITEVIARDGK